MLSDEYLTKGLTALSRAWTQKSAMVGHTGAAVTAAYFFCKENKLEDRTQELIEKLVDSLNNPVPYNSEAQTTSLK